MPTDRDNLRRGFTLPEATIALVILGMAAAGVLLPFSSGAAAQAEGVHKTLAAGLASDLMERIVATPYAEILAWNGTAEAQGQIRDAEGIVFTDPAYARFSRNVTCTGVRMYPQGGMSPQSGFILVVVRVYDRGRLMVTLSRLVSQ